MAIVLPKFSRRRVPTQRRLTRRAEPAIGLRLLSIQPRLEPNELLEFEYCVRRVEQDAVERLEISVTWYTEGKGSDDFGVHFFESLSGEELAPVLHGKHKHVCTTLPPCPMSYEGQLLKIRWCVRLRLYLTDGREVSAEQPFHLGHLTVDF